MLQDVLPQLRVLCISLLETIEELLQATKFNNKLRTMIQRSRR